ncbi:uncharacterized protein LTR77_006632 [Saxophila tyrrhenica]|uniref:Transcription initiation factor TFIID subunit 8 n=1 Tax=Saxophila tyrrhenica TaxID=1690608 RepID=A0AAV9P5U4_9PEZI|nr:hypothetical protein LTR77_006632 [Saxophila tyrrhenica]
MADTTPHRGTKRPHHDQNPHTTRTVRRKLYHVQSKPQHVEPASQAPVFAQGQLLRSISAALATAGFDSVKPSALEMFRSHTEEYMLNFLHDVRASMATSRRSKGTALDFASALAHTPNTSSASLLAPQLRFMVPESISFPSIPEPGPPPPPPQDFSSLLAPLVETQAPNYIPRHFPNLPPQHAWRHTDVYPERERDARKMREKATEEGIMAEQALRKLAAAAKAGAAKAEKRRLNTLSGPGRRVRDAGRNGKDRRRTQRESPADEDMFGDMMKELGGGVDQDETQAMELGLDGTNDLKEQGLDVGMPEGLVINSDMAGWRRGGRKGLRL